MAEDRLLSRFSSIVAINSFKETSRCFEIETSSSQNSSSSDMLVRCPEIVTDLFRSIFLLFALCGSEASYLFPTDPIVEYGLRTRWISAYQNLSAGRRIRPILSASTRCFYLPIRLSLMLFRALIRFMGGFGPRDPPIITI